MFVGELYPYQEEAKKRAVDRGKYLLAHVMGAGKTPTSIAVIEDLAELGKARMGLVVVPAALKYQWQEKIAEFSTGRSLVIDGTPAKRKVQYKLAPVCRYVILSYDTAINDWKYVRRLPYDYVLIDEATMIKSPKTIRSRKTKRLADGVAYRFALTGTPIENRPEELFSIMEFVDPTVLGDPQTFERTFIKRDQNGRFKYARNLKTLHKVLIPEACDRKSYDDIKDYLPDVVERDVPVVLDERTRAAYNWVRDDLLVHLAEAAKHGGTFDVLAHYGHSDGDSGDQARGDIAARLGALRMLCDSPHLLTLSADRFDDDDVKGGSQYASILKANGILDGLPKLSPKLTALTGAVDEIMMTADEAKVVIFSFFLPMLGLAQGVLSKYKSVLFHGQMSRGAREASRLAFVHDPKVRLFLSSDAGGYGLDLPMAQTLISLDLPWSAGKMAQRNSRIIRNSSQFDVVVNTAMLVRGSVEEWIKSVVVDKKSLGEAFLDAKFDARGTYTPSALSLQRFLQEHQV